MTKTLINMLAILIIVVALILTPAAVLLLMHYGLTGDLVTFKTLTRLTAAWSGIVVVAAIVIGSLVS